MQSEVKILLLGAAESGKSTVAKQMKIIHLQGFTQTDRITHRPIIFTNIVSSMKKLVDLCVNVHKLEVQNVESAQRILRMPSIIREFTPILLSDIKSLWAEPNIQNLLTQAEVLDNTTHYLAKIDKIAAEGYLPDDDDILRARAATAGVYEIMFDVGDANFRMIDVGGQRTERKKWIHCFEGVTAVLFCVSLSEYDQKLDEDGETNRMMESLNLFEDVCHSQWFIDTSIILFLNKSDIFADKIKRVPLNLCFPEYNEPNDFTHGTNYIQKKFVERDGNTNKGIYPHITCATDTESFKAVFTAVQDIILRIQLDRFFSPV